VRQRSSCSAHTARTSARARTGLLGGDFTCYPPAKLFDEVLAVDASSMRPFAAVDVADIVGKRPLWILASPAVRQRPPLDRSGVEDIARVSQRIRIICQVRNPRLLQFVGLTLSEDSKYCTRRDCRNLRWLSRLSGC
jgi:hypothetical protein